MTLVGYWPLNESSESKAYDYSRNENHGTLNGGVTQGATGLLGENAYSFDGTDGYVEISSSASINTGSKPFSVVHWLYYEGTESSNSYPRIFSRTDDRVETAIYTGNSSPTFAFFDDDTWTDISAIQKNSWNFLGLIWNGKKWLQIVNNSIYSRNAKTPDFSGDIAIGNRQGRYDEGVKGKISEVRIYDRPLTKSEIQYLYSVGKRGLQTTSKKTS